MAKSNGIKSLKQAAKLLNKHSPDGESLAYINPEEARVLKARGGSGIMTLAGVPTYGFWSDLGQKALEYAPKIFDYGQKALDLYNKGKNFLGGGDPKPDLPKGPPGQINQPFNPSQNINYDYPYYDQSGNVLKPWETTPFDPSQGNIPYEPQENPFWKDLGGSIFQSGKDFLKGRYGGSEGIKNIGKDAMSVWMALRAKKDQEGLNNAEMEQFNKLNQRMEAAQTQFTENIAGGGVENIPTDVSVFSETTGRPDMITTPTAAEGGRIGAFNGGIQGLMPQQGMPQQGMPQQGMPQQGMPQQGMPQQGMPQQGMPQPGLMPPQGLDPRMGYAAHGGRIGYNLGGITEEQNAMITDMLDKGMDNDTISTITGVTPEDIQIIINQINEAQRGLEQSGALENLDLKAHGGRIGAQGGGIMPLLDMGGMEKDYRQEGGFVPIGRREKADDVPARLSKNEFVFTADAVKAAGGGDIDEGAQRMYNVMKNLEAGGEISEQSQGQA